MKKFIYVIILIFIALYSKAQSDFVTPELKIQFDDNAYNHNFHIVSDGTYYYTSNGGSSAKGMINKYDLNGKFIQSYPIALDMRGLMYNTSDKCFYVNTYDKCLYKIANLSTGVVTKVFTSMTEYDQASVALSTDNNYLYSFYKGTLIKYKLSDGSLVSTFKNLKCGTSNFGGDGAVAVDDKNIYTCNADLKKIYVYDLNGTYVKELTIPSGSCGISLSYTNNLLFISTDGNYKVGTWYGYKIKSASENIANKTVTTDAADLIAPTLSVQFDDNAYNHNFHIVSDGTYYYTSNGGSSAKGMINKYDLTGKFIQSYPIALDMRGLMYNSSDKCFYTSTYDKGFYKISNLATGTYTKIYTSLYDYEQASLALSPDNNYIYYLYKGTLKKFKFSDGTLVSTFYPLKSGDNNLGGDGAVAVDDKYIYTCNGDLKKIFVYDMNGVFVKEFFVPSGSCGISLSYTNNLLFISTDGNYKVGTWYGYKIKNQAVVNKQVDADKEAPIITITEPQVSRGFILLEDKTIKIVGKATDASGIYEVLINDEDATVDANGNFTKTVLLAVGENKFTVKATDTKSNTTTQEFSIVRNAKTEVETEIPINNVGSDVNQIVTKGKYYALIIGCEEYLDPNINDLDNPVTDAQTLYDVLTKNYTFEATNVKFLKNPTVLQITQALDYYFDNCTKNDNLLIFYAGHGYWDEKFQQGYWLASDSYKETRGTWLSNSTLRDYMKAIPTKHSLLITDACFGGGIFKSRNAFANADIATNQLYELPSRKAMTSGALSEVPDKSVFIEYLVKRLSENTDNYLSSEQLYSKFKIAVINNSSNGQVPQFGEVKETGDEGGDFIFIKK